MFKEKDATHSYCMPRRSFFVRIEVGPKRLDWLARLSGTHRKKAIQCFFFQLGIFKKSPEGEHNEPLVVV
jgi:hypothetical protein